MAIYEFDGVAPRIHPSAFVHPLACLIGQVSVGADCYIAPFATLRGDFGAIEVAEGSNIQESCTLHVKHGQVCSLGRNSHIGHGAIVHGATLDSDCLVGMNAVVMDGAHLGFQSIIAACCFIKTDCLVPPRALMAGVPGTMVRLLSDQEVKGKLAATLRYQELAAACHHSLKLVE